MVCKVVMSRAQFHTEGTFIFFVLADDLCHWVTRNMFKYFIFTPSWQAAAAKRISKRMNQKKWNFFVN